MNIVAPCELRSPHKGELREVRLIKESLYGVLTLTQKNVFGSLVSVALLRTFPLYLVGLKEKI